MKVAVIGGGVVGLACAFWLRRAGAEVVVVEQQRCGNGASSGNAGWITPSLSAPLASPEVRRHALPWLLDRDGPLRIRPELKREYLRWCWRFWRSCSPDRYRAGAAALIALNEKTFELYDELRAAGVNFEMHSTGLVFLFRDERVLRSQREALTALQEVGYEGDVDALDRDALRHLEPAASDTVVGGLHVKSERYVHPETLLSGLVAFLGEAGVEIVEETEVTGLDRRARGGWDIRVHGGAVAADAVIVAAGAWSAKLLRLVDIRLPLLSGKGYSVTAVGSGTRPRHALYLSEAKIGCSPFDHSLRIAGTLELTGIDDSVNSRRVRSLVRSAAAYLRDWRPDSTAVEWAGMRPLAPDGLPLIGPVPERERLYVATGHGMLSVTLAPATAAALVPNVLGARPARDLRPFAIDRRL